MIPAWMISILSLLAAVLLWTVRPMPRLIRISIIVPLVYFSLLYWLIEYEYFNEVTKAGLIRLGFVVLLLPIISNSILVIWLRKRGKRP